MRYAALTALLLATALPIGAQAPRLSVLPAKPKPGAIVRLTLTQTPVAAAGITSVSGTFADEPLHFVPVGQGIWHAIAGVPVDRTGSITATALLNRSSGESETVRTRVTLPKVPPPPAQPLAVDNRFTQPLDSATRARIDRENASAREVGRRSHESAPMWTAPFLRPRTSVITSQFGSGRVFNGQLTARHLGVDFRGAVGEAVRAANRGVVALVGDFFLAGNVVYIDHGGGVVTAYFHLSETLVSPGDTVTRGQVIGRVGSSGRVTGPHLHWAARYGEVTVNPLDLVALARGWYSAPAKAQPVTAR